MPKISKPLLGEKDASRVGQAGVGMRSRARRLRHSAESANTKFIMDRPSRRPLPDADARHMLRAGRTPVQHVLAIAGERTEEDERGDGWRWMIHVMAVVMLSSMLEERCPRKRLGNSRGATPSTVRPGQLARHPPATLADASRAGAVHVCKNIPTAPAREICARQVPDALALPPVESCREASPRVRVHFQVHVRVPSGLALAIFESLAFAQV